MTYRVVQVTDDQLEATADGTGAVSVVSTAAFAGAPQAVAQVSKHTVRLQQVWGCHNYSHVGVNTDAQSHHVVCVSVVLPVDWLVPDSTFIQAVIQNPFSNGSSPGGETVGGETRFAYFPAATVSDGTATAVSVQAAADQTITQAGGETAAVWLHHLMEKWCTVRLKAGLKRMTDRMLLLPSFDPLTGICNSITSFFFLSENPGQFYVMMSSPEVLQTTAPRTIAPRTHTYTTWV